MTVSMDEIISKVVDLQASVRALEDMDDEDRVRASMRLASFFIEYAAFEMAVRRSPHEVSEMIVMAARLDRAATKIACKKPNNGGAQSLRK